MTEFYVDDYERLNKYCIVELLKRQIHDFNNAPDFLCKSNLVCFYVVCAKKKKKKRRRVLGMCDWSTAHLPTYLCMNDIDLQPRAEGFENLKFNLHRTN